MNARKIAPKLGLVFVLAILAVAALLVALGGSSEVKAESVEQGAVPQEIAAVVQGELTPTLWFPIFMDRYEAPWAGLSITVSQVPLVIEEPFTLTVSNPGNRPVNGVRVTNLEAPWEDWSWQVGTLPRGITTTILYPNYRMKMVFHAQGEYEGGSLQTDLSVPILCPIEVFGDRQEIKQRKTMYFRVVNNKKTRLPVYLVDYVGRTEEGTTFWNGWLDPGAATVVPWSSDIVFWHEIIPCETGGHCWDGVIVDVLPAEDADPDAQGADPAEVATAQAVLTSTGTYTEFLPIVTRPEVLSITVIATDGQWSRERDLYISFVGTQKTVLTLTWEYNTNGWGNYWTAPGGGWVGCGCTSAWACACTWWASDPGVITSTFPVTPTGVTWIEGFRSGVSNPISTLVHIEMYEGNVMVASKEVTLQ